MLWAAKPAFAAQPTTRPSTAIAQADCVTSECHAYVKDFRVVHGPGAADSCDACHNLTDVKRHTFKLRASGADLCTYCHEFSVKGLAVVHKPVSPPILLDRNYRLTIPAGSMPNQSGEHQLDFFARGGDADHDRNVNMLDFNALALNFNQTAGMDFRTGDFNYDGDVNALDFNAIASRFGTFLSAPVVPVGEPRPRRGENCLAGQQLRIAIGKSIRCSVIRVQSRKAPDAIVHDRQSEESLPTQRSGFLPTSIYAPGRISRRCRGGDSCLRHQEAFMTGQQSITPMEFWKSHARDGNIMLIDVSEPADYQRLHAVGSHFISLKDTMAIAKQARAANLKLYMISRQGRVAAAIGAELQRDGIDNVVTITGGTEAWAASGLPVCHADPVRETLFGLLEVSILIGAFLAMLIFPQLIMLVALAGAGFIVVALAVLDDGLGSKPARMTTASGVVEFTEHSELG